MQRGGLNRLKKAIREIDNAKFFASRAEGEELWNIRNALVLILEKHGYTITADYTLMRRERYEKQHGAEAV